MSLSACWPNRSLLNILPGVMQVTIKFGLETFIFHDISKQSRCQDLLFRLELKLGFKLDGKGVLLYEGRGLKIHQTVKEVRSRVWGFNRLVL